MVSGGIVHLFFRVHIELNKSKDNMVDKHQLARESKQPQQNFS
jgi:hypothetical protein